jgi:hypothetical protein
VNDFSSVVRTVASVSTAVGVLLAVYQLRQGSIQRRSTFEGTLVARYQEIQSRIPLAYLIDGHPYDESVRRSMFDYFELSEEQCYYFSRGQVSSKTWQNEWLPGIRANMEKPAFKEAWSNIAAATANDQFAALRNLCEPVVDLTDRPGDPPDSAALSLSETSSGARTPDVGVARPDR